MKFYFTVGFATLVVGLAIGAVVGWSIRSTDPPIQIHASATQGMDNFAIATGMIDIDNQLEGLYFLDYLTGNLRCTVIDTKTGKFNSFFTYNVASDFGADPKNAKYLMVTGVADVPRAKAGSQVADSIVYIAEATSGEVAAYAVPFNTSLQARSTTQNGTFIKLDKTTLRSTVVRD